METKMAKQNMSLEKQEDPTENAQKPEVKCDIAVGKKPETSNMTLDQCAKVKEG